MKRILLTISLVILALTCIAVNADAISGECSNCHTMHDRQGATADIGDAGAQEQLLREGCVTCHSGTHDIDGRDNGAPVVFDTEAVVLTQQGAGETNAGGDFYWVVNAAVDKDAKGHNVVGISAVDGVLGNEPPGWDYAATSADANPVTGGTGVWGAGFQLTCAGTYGCHGSRASADPLDAISGAHHNNDNTAGNGVLATEASAATTIANSYRFLLGIKGLENEFTNFKETAASHNEYFGASNTDAERDDETVPGNDDYLNRDTMSSFCAQCHGFFHSRIVANAAAVSSPWVRHPTDIVLPSPATEYALYNTTDGLLIGDYSLEAPVARGVVPSASSDTVTLDASDTGAIVMCLSCHRAHGSPENDMLRWTYSDMTVNDVNTGGCFTCHTTKNASTAHP